MLKYVLVFLMLFSGIAYAHKVDGWWHTSGMKGAIHDFGNAKVNFHSHPPSMNQPQQDETPKPRTFNLPINTETIVQDVSSITATPQIPIVVEAEAIPVPVVAPQVPEREVVPEEPIQPVERKQVFVPVTPKPQIPLCQNDVPTAMAIQITDVIHEKHPKRLIITFENASSRYIQFKDPFLRIAIISKDLKIRAVSEVKNRNTYGSTLLFALRNKKKTVKTAGIFTLGWHIRKKTIDYRADKNMYGALFATELRYYIPKTGETLYDTENDSIVILYNCDSRHTFNALKIGDTVQREHIIAEYPPPEAEAAPAAPSLFVRKAATTWGHLKRSE